MVMKKCLENWKNVQSVEMLVLGQSLEWKEDDENSLAPHFQQPVIQFFNKTEPPFEPFDNF